MFVSFSDIHPLLNSKGEGKRGKRSGAAGKQRGKGNKDPDWGSSKHKRREKSRRTRDLDSESRESQD